MAYRRCKPDLSITIDTIMSDFYVHTEFFFLTRNLFYSCSFFLICSTALRGVCGRQGSHKELTLGQ